MLLSISEIPVSVIFSTMTFILGFVIREWILFYSKNNSLKSKESFIRCSITNTLESIPKLIQGISLLMKNISQEEYRNVIVVTELQPSKLLKNEEDLFRIIIKRKKGKREFKEEVYNNILSSFQVLEALRLELINISNKYDIEITKYEYTMDEIGSKIYQNFQKDIIQNTMDPGLETIYNDYIEKFKKRSDVIQMLILPMENWIIDKKLKEHQHYLDYTTSYNSIFQFYEGTRKQYHAKLYEYKNNLKVILQELEKSIENFNSLKNRHRLF